MKKLLTMIGAAAATPRRGSLLYSMNKLIAAVAVAASAALPMAANAYNADATDDGISWRFSDYTAGENILLGLSGATRQGSNYTDWTNKNAIVGGTYDVETVGETLFLPTELSCTVSSIANRPVVGISARGMYGIPMKNVVIPGSYKHIYAYAFAGCGSLQNVLFRGPETATTDSYTIRWITTYVTFHSISGLKLVVIGPNAKLGGTQSYFKDYAFNAGSPTLLMPRRADNMTWDGYAPTSHSVNHYYGPAEAFDMTMTGMSATFIPTTEASLTNTLAWANTFKSAFQMEAKISATNRIVTSVASVNDTTIGTALVDPGAWHFIVFPVTTQAEMNALMTSLTVDVPLTIDVTGQTEDLAVPAGREVTVLAVGGKKIIRRTQGFIIFVK